MFTDRLVIGGNLTFQNSSTDSFGRNWNVSSSGFSIGSYIGYRLTTAWTLNGSVSVGLDDNVQGARIRPVHHAFVASATADNIDSTVADAT